MNFKHLLKHLVRFAAPWTGTIQATVSDTDGTVSNLDNNASGPMTFYLSELAEGSGVRLERASGSISHNFRTLIVNAAGHVQIVFPTGGNLSDAIVAEVLKAAAASRGGAPKPNDTKAPLQAAQVAR